MPDSVSIGDQSMINSSFGSTTSPSPEPDDPTRGLEQQIKASPTYQKAYELFSKDSQYGPTYLARLESIATSAKYAEEGFFANMVKYSKIDAKNDALYREILAQIDQLVQQYLEFINSLPSTQVEQRRQAGINDAVDGGTGISSSQFSPTDTPNMASNQMEITDPYDILQKFVGTMVSLSGGFTDIVNSGVNMFKNISDVELRYNQQFIDFAKYLNENGYMVSSDGTEFDFGKIVNDFNSSPRVSAFGLEQESRLINASLEQSYWSHNFMNVTPEIMQDLSEISIECALAKRRMEKSQFNYQAEYFSGLDGSNMADYAEASAKYSSKVAELNYDHSSKFRDYYWQLVDKWKVRADNGSWLHRQMLCQLLTGYNPFSTALKDVKDVMTAIPVL